MWCMGNRGGMVANLENPCSFRCVNLDMEDICVEGRSDDEDVVVDDIIGRLAEDPFGMNMTFRAALTGWLHDLGSDFDGFEVQESVQKSLDDEKSYKCLNWVYNGAMWFQPEDIGFMVDEISMGQTGFHGSMDGFSGSKRDLNEMVFCDSPNDDLNDSVGVCVDEEERGGEPHDALFLAIGYLGLKDLLAVEMVCRSLRDAVRGDPHLWRTFHVEQPLNWKITDDAILNLTNRAQGNLQCLSLAHCLYITDNGLKRVLESNPRMQKLSVPGCLRLSLEGILFNLRTFRSYSTSGIKMLRIGKRYGITSEQFEELKLLVAADKQIKPKPQKLRFFGREEQYLSYDDDDRAIDIESCPKCEKLGLVYDCPAESCQNHASQLCRGCTLCITRCFHCGCCINSFDYEESFCLDIICTDCWNGVMKSQEQSETNGSSSSCSFIQQMRYQFCLFG